MPGNVAEWCEDDFEESGYVYAHDLNPVYRDPRYKPEERVPGGANIRKVIRGGSWKDIGYFLSCGTRNCLRGIRTLDPCPHRHWARRSCLRRSVEFSRGDSRMPYSRSYVWSWQIFPVLSRLEHRSR